MPRNYEFEELLRSLVEHRTVYRREFHSQECKTSTSQPTPTTQEPVTEDEEEPASINSLHHYLLLEIFGHLAFPQELRPLIDVCSEWRALIMKYLPELWCAYHGVQRVIGSPRYGIAITSFTSLQAPPCIYRAGKETGLVHTCKQRYI